MRSCEEGQTKAGHTRSSRTCKLLFVAVGFLLLVAVAVSGLTSMSAASPPQSEAASPDMTREARSMEPADDSPLSDDSLKSDSEVHTALYKRTFLSVVVILDLLKCC